MSKRRQGGEGGQGDFEPRKVQVKPKLDGFDRAVFSTTTVVNHTRTEFCITFLQILQPLGPPEELRKIKSLDAHCVARVVVTPDHMEKLIEALQQNFEKYNRNLPQYDAENATMEKEEE